MVLTELVGLVSLVYFEGYADEIQVTLGPSKILLWAWAIGCSPVVALLGAVLGGSDGEAGKFVFLFCIVPAALTITLGRVLRQGPRTVIPAASVSMVMGLLVWGALVLALMSSGVFE
jgi:hypothetical protein